MNKYKELILIVNYLNLYNNNIIYLFLEFWYKDNPNYFLCIVHSGNHQELRYLIIYKCKFLNLIIYKKIRT